jgi:hypothetical protein
VPDISLEGTARAVVADARGAVPSGVADQQATQPHPRRRTPPRHDRIPRDVGHGGGVAAGGAVIDSSVVVSTFGAQVRFSRSSPAAFTSDRPSDRRHPLPRARSAGMPLWSRSDGDGPAVDDDAHRPLLV